MATRLAVISKLKSNIHLGENNDKNLLKSKLVSTNYCVNKSSKFTN